MSTSLPERVLGVRLGPEPIDVASVIDAVADPACGGLGLFVGTVRDTDEATGPGEVTGLTYTAHPAAADELARVAAEVASRHDVRGVAVEHRTGSLRVGDIAVVVACAAVHRAPALAACADLIDTLKEQVPIWKEQTWAGGASTWPGV
ncbi:molybdenum cofactor biosynthesis protein MoaE [Naumannella cuiyingiana]|uniref:Molybdopterin synthase catalytic subunit n=1 Tax=Naumannella cuiyingiana TaxID=1347891 RepID=A0A7Z0D6H3_9ACTN|nr:molybdopterin synthase catalytic subunit [Naumannella cuiyingiana]